MRVTNNMMFAAGVTALQAQQQEIMQAQAQSVSGMRIQKPSDDPSGIFRHLLFSSDLSGVQSLKRNTDIAAQRLVTGDTSLGTAHNSMMRAYELAMNFAHGTAGNDPEILKGSATEALALYQNILTVANMEMDGVPLFGGGRTNTPFDDTHLQTTEVLVQSNGVGSHRPVPAGLVAGVDATFVVPDEQVGLKTSYVITPSTTEAGAYDVDINGVRQDLPIFPTERIGMDPYLDLGNGVTINMGGSLGEGDRLFFDVLPPANARFYKVSPAADGGGGYDVDVNGVRQGTSVFPKERTDQNSVLDLGNGLTLDMGSELGMRVEGGETVSFVPPGTLFTTTTPKLFPNEADAPTDVNVSVGFSAKVAPGATFDDLPLSIKLSYQASTGKYAVNINGVERAPVEVRPGRPPLLDLGNGVTFNLVGQPKVGDIFFFEVVPSYQGGEADRPILVSGGKTLPGNVTGGEFVEGGGSIGKGINILGALASLRGALLRGDSAEVAVQLDRLQAGRAQTSDMQSLTGVRSTQMDMTASILASDEGTLQSLKADNSEADLFAVMSRLQQASQSMQMLTTTEREVLNISLLDFIR
ncbi:MAG: hypothetical protein HQL90_06570 [Magnetococcales bacterium]|nr:hypothetical protein [Magnetococcales bacterium]